MIGIDIFRQRYYAYADMGKELGGKEKLKTEVNGAKPEARGAKPEVNVALPENADLTGKPRIINNRPALWCALSAVAGVAVAVASGLSLPAILTVTAGAIFVVVYLSSKKRFLILYPIVFLLAFFSCTYCQFEVKVPVFGEDEAVLVEGRVTAITEDYEGGLYLRISETKIDGVYAGNDVLIGPIFFVYEEPEFEPTGSDALRASALAEDVAPAVSAKDVFPVLIEDDADDMTTHLSLGSIIYAEGYLKRIEIDWLNPWRMSTLLEGVRYTMVSYRGDVTGKGGLSGFEWTRWSVSEAFFLNMDERSAGISAGVLFGDNYLDKDTRDAYAIAGILHIFSVSGLHVGFFIFLLDRLLRALRLGFKARFLVSVAILILLIGVTGFGAGLVRAVIMYAILTVSTLWAKEYDSLSALMTAATLILLLTPFALFDISFLLSFLAVLGIICFGKPIRKAITPRDADPKGFYAKYVAPLLALSLSSNIFTMPLAAYAWGNVSLIFPLTNLIAVPFISVVYGFLVVFGGLSALIPALGFTLAPFSYLLLGQHYAMLYLSKIPFASVPASLPAWAVAVFAVGIFCISGFVMVWKKKQGHKPAPTSPLNN